MADSKPPVIGDDGINDSSSGPENDMDDWNFVNVSAPASAGTSTPMTNSSCEFVRVTEDGMEYKKKQKDCLQHSDDASSDDYEGAAEPTDTVGVQGQTEEPPSLSDSEIDESKDEELRRLMVILQEKVRSGSPSNSISTDSDFVHLHGTEREPDDLIDSHSSAGSRFNIIVQREPPNPFEHSDDEDEDDTIRLRDLDDGSLPDADDRVESDILAARDVAEVAASQADVHEDDFVQPIRHYRHSPNRHLNTLLTSLALTALGFALGIAIGHSFGSAREAYLQQEIQEGQRLRLKAVQDDLLMCLRKQEDIDQTINKLNEIENILVDAEHWRNEYEELLNIKLENEEKWKVERSLYKDTLETKERSYDELIRSKSCTHDSEFLSRQETTLQSVHEKLEASITDKDQLIEKLQAEVSDLRINLKTAEHMLKGYKKSNDEKSLLILSLKEQYLEVEREVFDLRITTQIHAETSPNLTSYNNSDQAVKSNNDKSADVEIAGQSQPPRDDSAELLQTQRESAQIGGNSELEHLKQEVALYQTKISELNHELERVKAVSQPSLGTLTTSDSNDVNNDPHDADVDLAPVEDLAPPQVEVEILEDDTAHQQTIWLLEEQIITLQEEVKILRGEKMGTEGNSTNQTELACVVFNLCDQLRINVTRDQVLQLYNVSREKYRTFEAFLLAEWKSLTRGWKHHAEQDSTDETSKEESSSFDPRTAWKDYVNKTRSSVTDFMSTVNSTWQEVKILSQAFIDPDHSLDTSGVHRKINKKLSKLTKSIRKGFETVKGHLKDKFGNMKNSDIDPSAEFDQSDTSNGHQRQPPKPDHVPVNEPKSTDTHRTKAAYPERVNTVNKKFNRRLEKLTQDVQHLDERRFRNMKRHAREDIYERFDDFQDDYEYMFSNPDLDQVKVWIDCQALWWKQLVNKDQLDTVEFVRLCSDNLMDWQRAQTMAEFDVPLEQNYETHEAHEPDSRWQFERAEWRKFHRDEPDDWYWRRSHDHESLPHYTPTEIPFPRDEM